VPPAPHDPGLLRHLADRVADPVRPLRLRQPFPPVHQRGRIKPRVIQRRADGHLPPHVELHRLGGLPVRIVMQHLQGQHRGHLRSRQRRPAHPRRGEQVRVISVGEHLGPVRGQEREHAARRDQMPGQRRRVRQLPVCPLETLHDRHCPRPSNVKPAKHPDLPTFFSRLLASRGMIEDDVPLGLAGLVVPLAGAVEAIGDPFEPYRLVDPEGAPVLPVTVFLADLHACGRSALTQRSYSMALLRWFRFLWSAGVPWDQATRMEARIGPVRAVAGKPTRRHWRSGDDAAGARPGIPVPNRVTGKPPPVPRHPGQPCPPGIAPIRLTTWCAIGRAGRNG
jgi:hypothetical protein